MAIGVEKNIFWLEVTVNDVLRMEVSKTKSNLSRVESCATLTEATVIFEVKEEFATGEIVHHKVELTFCLKGEMKSHKKGMLNLFQNFSLRLSVLNLVSLDNSFLTKHLHSINPVLVTIPFLANHHNLTKASTANNFEKLKVFWADIGSLLAPTRHVTLLNGRCHWVRASIGVSSGDSSPPNRAALATATLQAAAAAPSSTMQAASATTGVRHCR
mmetsp:Transcript_5536/g.11381  ORF Transcript_5536/g.11381 Transcript_5536/m.11381 type:complete len:215 (-) Transcript_5536:652-1296(-)